jgi:hypothetical protein
LDDKQVLTDIARLDRYMSIRISKWNRNLGRYGYAPLRSQVTNIYSQPMGYWPNPFNSEQDVAPPCTINILASMVDTVVSKISATKVRPYATPVLGNYKTRKLCKTSQLFFDRFFELKKIYKQSTECLRDALIFELGCMWVRDDIASVERIKPWESKFDPAELNYGRVERWLVDLLDYPLYYLKTTNQKVRDALEKDPYAKGRVQIYYNFGEGKVRTVIADDVVETRKIGYSEPPVVWMYFKEPIRGCQSTSMVDEVYGFQVAIDTTIERINAAAQLTPANSIFVPTNNEVKPSMISNRAGNVYTYIPMEGSAPMEVVTPRPIDNMYLDLLNFYIKTPYEMQGISQMSSQSKKEPGVTSGVAIQTLDDIESDRHNVILQAYINFQSQIAERMINNFPANAEVLPYSMGRSHDITWGDIKQGKDLFNIQFSAASSLSKDPATKMQQINALIQSGFLSKDQAAKYMDMPDIEEAFSGLTASYDECQKIIERAVEKGIVDFPETANMDQLFTELVTLYNQLDSADESPAIMDRVKKLMQAVIDKRQELQVVMNPQDQQQQGQPEQPGQEQNEDYIPNNVTTKRMANIRPSEMPSGGWGTESSAPVGPNIETQGVPNV